jgi:hypothetical protein
MSNSGTKTMPIPIPPITIGASRSTVDTPPPAMRSTGSPGQPGRLDDQPGEQHAPAQLGHGDARRPRSR